MPAPPRPPRSTTSPPRGTSYSPHRAPNWTKSREINDSLFRQSLISRDFVHLDGLSCVKDPRTEQLPRARPAYQAARSGDPMSPRMQRVINIVTVALSLIPLVWLACNLPGLPENVPVHFGSANIPDRNHVSHAPLPSSTQRVNAGGGRRCSSRRVPHEPKAPVGPSCESGLFEVARNSGVPRPVGAHPLCTSN